MASTNKCHMGSSIDDFMAEEGCFEAAQAQAIEEVVAWHANQGLREGGASAQPVDLA